MRRGSQMLAIFIILMAICHSALGQGCSQSLASICACDMTYHGPSLYCDGVTNITDLANRIHSEDVEINKLTIRGKNIERLEETAFGELNVKHIDLSNNPALNMVSNTSFTGQSSTLHSLSLANCSLHTIPHFANMTSLTRLDISGNRQLSDIPLNVFAELPNLKHLDLSRCNVCKLVSGALSEIRASIEYLTLANNCLKSVPAASLRGAHFLQLLDLSGNRIEQLPNMQFMNLPLLTEVRLNNNHITGFRLMTFMNVPNLQHINLANNRLSKLNGNLFQALKRLEKLDLSNNQVTNLGSNTFVELPNLRQLYLDDNKIAQIETLAFSSLPSLSFISLQRNQIVSIYRNSFESCPSLTILQLNNNHIDRIGQGMFAGMPNLQQLHLRASHITSIQEGSFVGVPLLTTLDIGNNRLTQLPKNAINNLQNLFWLDVSDNELSSFEQGVFPPNLGTMLVHGNKLSCAASMNWFVRYLVENQIRTFLPNQPDILCASPEDLQGTRLKDLMIRTAGVMMNETRNNPSNGLNLGGLGQLLPNLLGGRQGNAIPAASLVQFLQQGGIDVNSFTPPPGTQPVNHASPAYATTQAVYQPTAVDIGQLISAVSGNQQFTIDQLSPGLTKHLLGGGQIPGVPRATLDAMLGGYMRQMAIAAQQSNSGIQSAQIAKIMPNVHYLPIEFIQNVANGRQLNGLSLAETSAIRDYYVRQLSTPATATFAPSPTSTHTMIITGEPNNGAMVAEPTGGLRGIGPEELIRRLPPSFDLSRLPPDMLASIASGGEFEIARLPLDMIEEFKRHNPDLIDVIDEALRRKPRFGAATESPGYYVPVTRRTIHPDSNVLVPYDIRDIDRQVDVLLENTDAQEETILLYTAGGLAVIGVISVLVLGYMCWRRQQTLNDNVVQASHNDTTQFINGSGPYHQRRSTSNGTQNKLQPGVPMSATTYPLAPPPPPPPSASPLQLQHQSIVQRHLPGHQFNNSFDQFMRGYETTSRGEVGSPQIASAASHHSVYRNHTGMGSKTSNR